MKKCMKLRTVCIISALLGLALSVGTIAATPDPLLQGLNTAAQEGGLLIDMKPEDVNKNATDLTAAKIGVLLQGGLSLIGILFLVLTLYGGFVYMTAGGDVAKTQEGRKYLINATIGLAIVSASYAVTKYILGLLLTT